jgi:hypothetical protein
MKIAKTAATLVMALIVAFTTVFMVDASRPIRSGFSIQSQVDHGAPIEPEDAKALIGVGLASKPSVMDPAKPLKPTSDPPAVPENSGNMVQSNPPTAGPAPTPMENGAAQESAAPSGMTPASATMSSGPQSITTTKVSAEPSASVTASTSTPTASVSSSASTSVTQRSK